MLYSRKRFLYVLQSMLNGVDTIIAFLAYQDSEEMMRGTRPRSEWLCRNLAFTDLFLFAGITVTRPIYLDVMQEFLEAQLVSDFIISAAVFQQNGATCHYGTNARYYLNEWIRNRIGAPK